METTKPNAAKKDVLSYVLISFFAAFNICFFTPFDVFITNVSDIAFPLKPFLLFLGGLTLAVFAALLFVMNFTRGKANRIFCAVVFAISAGLYIQGNFLAINMGELRGADYVLPPWKAVLNVVIWLIILAAPFVVLKKYKGNVVNLFSHISAAIILIQIIALGASVYMCIPKITKDMYETLMHGDAIPYCTSDNLDLYSTNRNFIILLTDEYDSECFDNAVETAPETVSEFDGFTYYNNTIGRYPFTYQSIECITTGSFSFEDPENYSNQTLYKTLDEKFKSNWYCDGSIPPVAVTAKYSNNNKFKKISFGDTAAYSGYIYKLSFFRCMPEVLKPLFATDGMNISLSINNMDDETLYSPYNLDFYNNMPGEFRTTDEAVFKYIHIMGIHSPVNISQDLELLPVGATIEGQSIAVNKIANKYLRILKENGVYDNSDIFIMADHGHNNYREHPLLMY